MTKSAYDTLIELLEKFVAGPDRTTRAANEIESAFCELVDTGVSGTDLDPLSDLELSLALYRPGGEPGTIDRSGATPVAPAWGGSLARDSLQRHKPW